MVAGAPEHPAAALVQDVRLLVEFLDTLRTELDWVATNAEDLSGIFHSAVPAYLPPAWAEVRPHCLDAARDLVARSRDSSLRLSQLGLRGPLLHLKLHVVSVQRERWYNLRRSSAPPGAKGKQLRRYLGAVRGPVGALAPAIPNLRRLRDFLDTLSIGLRDDFA
ncbi:MAG TPA: hypothetical protein VFF67_02160 [Thermoplasmata archaeon]|nr:hypothetical protein [Thermoplasmata archaeon]